MIEGFGEIHEKVQKLYGNTYFMETAINNYGNDFLIKYVQNLDPPIDDCVEIGTYNGLATIVLASASKRVHTFDVAYRDAEFLWNKLYPKLRSKINYTVGSQEIIDDQLRRIFYFHGKDGFNINFAFIDGGHTYENVKHDFELVKGCGRVLFHDADILGIKKFLEEIEADVLDFSDGMFALWEK